MTSKKVGKRFWARTWILEIERERGGAEGEGQGKENECNRKGRCALKWMWGWRRRDTDRQVEGKHTNNKKYVGPKWCSIHALFFTRESTFQVLYREFL